MTMYGVLYFRCFALSPLSPTLHSGKDAPTPTHTRCPPNDTATAALSPRRPYPLYATLSSHEATRPLSIQEFILPINFSDVLTYCHSILFPLLSFIPLCPENKTTACAGIGCGDQHISYVFPGDLPWSTTAPEGSETKVLLP